MLLLLFPVPNLKYEFFGLLPVFGSLDLSSSIVVAGARVGGLRTLVVPLSGSNTHRSWLFFD